MKTRQTTMDEIGYFFFDEQGAEVTELAIILALIVAGCVLVIITLGGKVSGNYTTFNSQLP